MGRRLTATTDTESPSASAEGGDASRLRPRTLATAGRAAPRAERRGENYWTVMVPFMPIARCGVQWNGYCPGLMLANEIV